MEKVEFVDCLVHMDVVEALIKAEKAREFIAKGETEDAIAYAMAAGFRMGWEAYKKKVSNSNDK